MKILGKSSSLTILFLLLATGVAAWFRLHLLGEPALRSDTITFWRICTSGLTMGQIFEKWISLGHTGHFPFANAFIKGFNDFFGLEINHFTLRLPSAIWGTLCIPAAFLLGRRFGSSAFAVFLAFFVAINPYHVQTTREAYFYPPMILGSFLFTWALLEFVEHAWEGKRARWWVLAGAFVGSFLMIYSVPAGWLLFVVGLALMTFFGFRLKQRGGGVGSKGLWKAVGILLLLIIPFFTQSWGFGQFGEHVGSGSVKEAGGKAAAHMTDHAGTLLSTFLTRFAFGNTPLRLSVMVIAVVSGVLYLLRIRKTSHAPFILGTTCLAVFAFFLAVRGQVNMLYEARYIIALMPAYLLLLALGLWHLPGAIRIEKFGAKLPAAMRVLTVVATFLLLVPSAYNATTLTGQPAPYKEIQKWVDTELPRGTLVLVDRWFEPWNELAVYPSTNVFFTYTIPNEPLETFLKYNWRDTAINFFEQYQGAAYLEINRSYWEVKEVGPWAWPRTHFARRKVFENTGGLKLREVGLAARPDFYAPSTNKTVVELFYNTREDLIEKARSEGQKLIMFYGDEWGYRKTQDHRDWRLLTGAASLEVINLVGQPIGATLQISGLTPSTQKTVIFQNQGMHFKPSQPMGYSIRLQNLAPGSTRLEFKDAAPGNQEPVFVSRISVLPDI